MGGTAVAEVVPVGTSEAADRLVNRAVEEFGRLDVLVTNAGILRDKVLWKMTDDDFDAVITTHLRGTFTCARAAAVRLREQGEGGTLILVGSPAGSSAATSARRNYAAAKAGIAAMARTWSMDAGPRAITVNAIVPVAATAMTETVLAFAPYVEAMRDGEPLPDFLPQDRRRVRDPRGLRGPRLPFTRLRGGPRVTGRCIGIGGDKVALWCIPGDRGGVRRRRLDPRGPGCRLPRLGRRR